MVSFSCEACNETMAKKKVQQHLGRCHAAVTCIDCSKTFPGTSFKDHNQCMTEDQKYQGKLYKPKSKSAKPEQAASEPPKPAAPKDAGKTTKSRASEAPAVKQARHVKVTKQTPLKKVLKQLKKEYNVDRKKLLSELVVDPEGRISFA